MYQPALRPDQIKALYHLKVALRRPMTKLTREAVDRYLHEMQRKAEEACRYGTTLLYWLTYAQERAAEAGTAAKQSADLADVNTPL